MSTIKFLGAAGGRSSDYKTTSIQLSKSAFIDAGNLSSLGEGVLDIEHIFLTHSHLDHILDLAFIMDYALEKRKKPVKVYGLAETLASLEEHIFCGSIWPNFLKINLPLTSQPSMEFIPIEIGQTYEVEAGLILKPLKAEHSVPTCGYMIEKNGVATIFAADSYKTQDIWDEANSNPKVTSIILDVSFPDRLEKLAETSKHFTPKTLQTELTKLKKPEITTFIFHLKPSHREEILDDLAKIGIQPDKVIEDGECINLSAAKKVSLGSLSLESRIKKLNKIGIALSAEKNLDLLLEMIVTQAKSLTGADGGTLYLLKDDKLHFTVAQTDSLGVSMGGKGAKITWPPLPTQLEDGSPNTKAVAVVSAMQDRVLNIADVYQNSEFSFEGAKFFDKQNNYRSQSMLVIPLKDFDNKVIGVLQLLNKKNPNGQTVTFYQDDVEVTQSLASQAAVALTNAKLIEDLEVLLESFLNSIIYLMGKKSVYTENHIKRMVVLTDMLAKAINEDSQFFEKKFNQEELRTIHLAALMHDIGKLATPEVIMDKATKLDGHFDKIHLVREKAKWLKAEIEKYALEQLLPPYLEELTEEKQQQIQLEKQEQLARLEAGLELIEKSNLGAEFLPEEQVAAIQDLAKTPFVIGELAELLITPEDAYALSVQRGTLTDEERKVINDHARIGLDVLEQLPFPDKYKAIPHIAGAHHEKINGQGYPLGLAGDEISFEARILAVADVFEAITSSDRPYKKPNSLSTAMKIMWFMAKDNELDRDLVKFFYESGLYKDYAAKFLKPELIDEVNLDFNFE